MMSRRFMAAIAITALAAPLCSVAQTPQKTWRVGILSSREPFTSLDADYWGELVRGLNALGYLQGKNLIIEWRFAAGNYPRLPALAAELVGLRVDVILTDGTPPTIAAKAATSRIPIVFASVGDPVAAGVVKTLARPGGNATGLSIMGYDTPVKQLEMLSLIVPGLRRLAVLANPTNPAHASDALRDLWAAAQTRGVEPLRIEARNPEEVEEGFARIAVAHSSAFIWMPDLFFTQQRPQIVALAAQFRIPGMGPLQYVDAGGLMGYGPNLSANYRRAATYVDRILKGANPRDLPVEQPTKFELAINRRTAKALGLTIPPELLLQSDRVIE